jgi:SAM-dependent methyltransferase
VSGSSVFPIFDREVTERWDAEWLNYLSTESMYPHLVPAAGLSLIGNLQGAPPSQTYETVLTADARYGPLGPLGIWCPGDELVGRNVLEIGCGCGFLGKQLGLVCGHYLGLDYSELALAIARGASPSNCEYRHVCDGPALEPQRARYDVAVGRQFFIHQNFNSALTVMGIAAFLLKRGGFICADFYCANPLVPQGIVYPARAPLDPINPSCGFEYSDADVAELAAAHRLNVVSTSLDREKQRRFVIFETA